MPGIVSWAAYLPHWRLDRAEISAIAGQGGGRGRRTVAGFDEDSVTLSVEAARRALAQCSTGPDLLLFATTNPTYFDKTNATIVHAALQLDAEVQAFDLGASVRSAVGGLAVGLRSAGTSLVAAGDVRFGLAGSADEAAGADAGAAVIVSDGASGAEIVAELVASAAITEEFIERWRAPGEVRTKTWDERFAEVQYRPLVNAAWKRALNDAGLGADEITLVGVSAPTERLSSRISGDLGAAHIVESVGSSVGIAGAAQPLLVLADLLERARSLPVGALIGLVSAADGAEVILLRTTEALSSFESSPTLAEQSQAGAPVSYGRFLQWRSLLPVEPPRRPEPQRVSASAAARSTQWKYGFTGSQDSETGRVHLPPARVSADGSRTDQMHRVPMSSVQGTVVTYTIDRLAYSPSPPIVFAVVDFDGGGRLPVELCDVDPGEVAIGMRVEPTFRRLGTADGIANYFWKARPAITSPDGDGTARTETSREI